MNWRTTWRRLQRWTTADISGRVLAGLLALSAVLTSRPGIGQRPMAADAGWHVHMLDTTAIRVHACAARATKAGGGQALARSLGGFSTKLHLRADVHGRPVALHLKGGERHDLLGVEPLREQVASRTGRRGRARWKSAAVIADIAFSAAWLLDVLRREHIVPIIPNRINQPHTSEFDRDVYRQRNLIERLSAGSSSSGVWQPDTFKPQSGPKLAEYYLVFVQIALRVTWLQSFGDTT